MPSIYLFIFSLKNVVIKLIWHFSASVLLLKENESEVKRSAMFDKGAIARSWFRLRMSRILLAAKQRWTTLRKSRPLFAGSYLQSRGGLSTNKRKKNLHRMIITFVRALSSIPPRRRYFGSSNNPPQRTVGGYALMTKHIVFCYNGPWFVQPLKWLIVVNQLFCLLTHY